MTATSWGGQGGWELSALLCEWAPDPASQSVSHCPCLCACSSSEAKQLDFFEFTFERQVLGVNSPVCTVALSIVTRDCSDPIFGNFQKQFWGVSIYL